MTNILITVLGLAFATTFTAVAQADMNNCAKYENKPRYLKAIEAVAAFEKSAMDSLCQDARILDIEAQPSRVVTPQGDVIPHVQLQLHMATRSCLYMVRDADQSITSHRCYSGW